MLLLIFLSAFLLKIYFATREPLIHNIDAGYYVKHINEVLEQGFPDVSDPPLAFYGAAVFSLVFNVMVGFKIAISLASAGIAFPVFSLVKYITKRKDVALFGAFLAAFSSVNMFMMGDLLKNEFGLFFGVWFIYFLIRTSDRFTMQDAGLSILMLVFMVGSHFSSSGYVVFCIAPYMVLLPAYNYWKDKKLSRESLFCFAMIGIMLIAGLSAILLRGFDVESGRVGIVGLQEHHGPGINFSLLNKYNIFAVFFLLGLFVIRRINMKYMLLFIPWLLVSFLLTQSFLVDEGWTFRFMWDSYILVAIVSAAGISYFRKEKMLFYGIILLISLYVLTTFLEAANDTHPVIYFEEWEGLLSLHKERPDIVFTKMFGGTEYWVEAAGFQVIGGPGDQTSHLLLCAPKTGHPALETEQYPPATENRWLKAGCENTIRVPLTMVQKMAAEGEVVAHFGRFNVVKETDFEMPEDWGHE